MNTIDTVDSCGAQSMHFFRKIVATRHVRVFMVVMSMSVCMPICPHAYLCNQTSDLFLKFSVHVTYNRGSVIL